MTSYALCTLTIPLTVVAEPKACPKSIYSSRVCVDHEVREMTIPYAQEIVADGESGMASDALLS